MTTVIREDRNFWLTGTSPLLIEFDSASPYSQMTSAKGSFRTSLSHYAKLCDWFLWNPLQRSITKLLTHSGAPFRNSRCAGRDRIQTPWNSVWGKMGFTPSDSTCSLSPNTGQSSRTGSPLKKPSLCRLAPSDPGRKTCDVSLALLIAWKRSRSDQTASADSLLTAAIAERYRIEPTKRTQRQDRQVSLVFVGTRTFKLANSSLFSN